MDILAGTYFEILEAQQKKFKFRLYLMNCIEIKNTPNFLTVFQPIFSNDTFMDRYEKNLHFILSIYSKQKQIKRNFY